MYFGNKIYKINKIILSYNIMSNNNEYTRLYKKEKINKNLTLSYKERINKK